MNKLLPYLERAFLTLLVISIVLQRLEIAIPILMKLSLLGLGVTFFLSAYRPLNIEPEVDEEMGFNELLGLTIIPKILWISSAIATIGITLYTLKLGNDGYVRLLYIGGSTIMIATLIQLGLKATGTKYIGATLPVFFRALPTLFVAAYMILESTK